MNIKKFFEYHTNGDGTSEESLLSKMEKNNKTRYNELISKIDVTFNTKDDVVNYVKSLISKGINTITYILLDTKMEYNMIYKFEIKDAYYTIYIYSLSEDETNNGTKFQIYSNTSVGSRSEHDIYSEIKNG